jgi:prepilin-type processing-associated H-X9-DG protein
LSNYDWVYAQPFGPLTRSGYLPQYSDSGRQLLACPDAAAYWGSQWQYGVRTNYAMNGNLIYDKTIQGSSGAEFYTRIIDNRIAKSPSTIGWAIDQGRSGTPGAPSWPYSAAARHRIKVYVGGTSGNDGQAEWLHLGRTANVLYFDGHAGNVAPDVSIWMYWNGDPFQQTNQGGDPSKRLYW